MNTRPWWPLVTILLAPLAAAAAPAADCRAEAADGRAIRDVAAGIVAADNARDIERVLGYYASDAILMPPGEAPVSGRDRIRPRYEQLFAGFNPQIQTHIDEACVAGGTAYVRGANTGRMMPRASGEPRELDDAFIMLLRRESNGWRISHLIWHRQSGPAPPGRPR